MMKKNLLFAVIAGLAVMTGCSKNEVIENTPNGEQDRMEFTPVVGKQTRASEMTSNSLQSTGTTLNLYGYRTPKTFSERNSESSLTKFFGRTPETLTFNGGWSTQSDYEWASLNGGKLSIFTYYSPTGALSGITEPTTSSAASFDYTVPNTVLTQEDLLVAAHLDMDKGSTNGIIKINFKHALSQLFFRAKLNNFNYKVVIKEIKVLQAKNSGKFTYTADAADAAVGSWTPNAGTYNYTYVEKLSTEITSAQTPVRIGDDTTGALMLMPQDADADKFQFEVTYDVFDLQGALISSKTAKTADMTALEMGKKYAYTLLLPASQNDKIAFDVAVSEWDATSVATEREVRFDEYTLTATAADDAVALRNLITGYTPSVIYLQEVMVTGTLAGTATIDLTGLPANATAGSKIVLDCSTATITGSNKVTVTLPSPGWSADKNELSAAGKITITKN